MFQREKGIKMCWCCRYGVGDGVVVVVTVVVIILALLPLIIGKTSPPPLPVRSSHPVLHANLGENTCKRRVCCRGIAMRDRTKGSPVVVELNGGLVCLCFTVVIIFEKKN